jgi:hypothetical protein
MNAQRNGLVLTAMAAALFLAGPNANAQSVFRPPNLNITPRVVTPPPAPAAPRIDPNIAGRVTDVGGATRYSPNLTTNGPQGGNNGGGNGGSGSNSKKANNSRNNGVQSTIASSTVNNELLA